ncbi:MAG: hypothetical protein IKB01_08500 [Lachnospiraceae bacterium]|nr:hypothetical protein [Lachnospiraceae bacterium]
MKSGQYKEYETVGYEDYPAKTTKVNAARLNQTDERVKQHDNRLVAAESVLADREEITLSMDAWVQSEEHEGYYEQTVNLTKEHTQNAETRIRTEGIIPTSTEKDNFGKMEEMLISDELDQVTYLCSELPTADVLAYVVG